MDQGILCKYRLCRRLLTSSKIWNELRQRGYVYNYVTNASEPVPNNDEEKNGLAVKNFCNVQMISDSLYSQVFIDQYRERTHNQGLVSKCKQHLEKHSLWDQKVPVYDPVDFKLPMLEGVDINDHFQNIARQQTFRHKTLMDELIKEGIPRPPSTWIMQPGWTRYASDGLCSRVPFPEENGTVFDVEVLQSTGQIPTIACAVSTKAWYAWCSDSVVEGKLRDTMLKNTLHEFIPFETRVGEANPDNKQWIEKVVIGHNVCYDRARVKEQYYIEGTKLRFMDTMSLHIAISGITSFQRALKLTAKKGLKSQPKENVIQFNSDEWNEVSSLNNLADVYKLYCGQEMSKLERNIFITGTIQDVVKDFQNLMSYCARDVKATYDVFAKLMPMFYERFPHPVTLAGMLEMGSTYLPINTNWEKYIKKSDDTFDSLEKEIKAVLMEKAEEALKLLPNEKYKEDPWLWDLDWKVTKPRVKKDCKDNTNSTTLAYPAWYKKLLYKVGDEDYMPGPAKISTSMRAVPKLLRLCWFGFPIHYSKNGGWGFLVKKNQMPNDTSNDSTVIQEEYSDGTNEKADDTPVFPYEKWEAIWTKNKNKLFKQIKNSNVEILKNSVHNKTEDAVQDIADFVKGLSKLSSIGLFSDSKKKNAKAMKSFDNCSPHVKCEFYPLPHKDGLKNKVGSPLAKDFLSKIEEGILTCESGEEIANKVVRISKMVSYWRNNRDRIMGQLAVWVKNNELPGTLKRNKENCEDYQYGAILPQVSVSGTLTRRAVEPTWMTASNAYVDRVGSELKGMIQAPESYHFVGSDVDSQELWIAAVIGDAHFAGVHGSTALGWMTLQGNKSAGTDVHSKTASLIGIDRDQAKVLNYGRIYGAGVRFAERLLMQFNHQMNSTEAKSKAKAMYKMTKGERKYRLSAEGRQLADKIEKFKERKFDPFSKAAVEEMIYCSHCPPVDFTDVVEKMVWDNGTESHMFNRLEEIAQRDCPRTPILNCCISRSLIPSVVQDDFMTSRVNWVVQSSAVDYLHLMLTCMSWLIKKYDIKARFSISVHDEVRYLVDSEDRYRAALALQITNLLTRAFCSYQLGMYDLPQSVAFFSCVDIDKVLRKEVHQDCKTPSNPQGLKVGYNIPKGEALNIQQILQITKGSLLKR